MEPQLICGIMPTKGRPKYAAQALRCFLDQDYERKLLVVLDDGADRSFTGGIEHPLVHYAVHEKPLNIPQKLNRCCEFINAPIYARFDSDDWSAPNRLSEQAKLFTDASVAVVAFNSMLIWREVQKSALRYRNTKYGMGTSLMFRRDWWLAHKFPEDKKLCSDNYFWYEARDLKRTKNADAGTLMVARFHAHQSSQKTIGSHYKPVTREAIPQEFFE